MKSLVLQAYLATRNGFSSDRVVADPQLNAQFVDSCREIGFTGSTRELNLSLLNIRKAGLLKGLPRSKTTTFPDEDDYRFASEVAARFTEQKHNVSLDVVICDPDLVQEFDQLAANIAPGYSPLQYRWAALNLRKAKKLQPELLSRVVKTETIELGLLSNIDPKQLPVRQGIYLFYSVDEVLYIGEAQNLRVRLEKHIDHSDNKGLAHWLWENGMSQVYLEVRTLPSSTETRVRKALEADLIRSRDPRFNIKLK